MNRIAHSCRPFDCLQIRDERDINQSDQGCPETRGSAIGPQAVMRDVVG